MAGDCFVVESCVEDAPPALDILQHTLLRFYWRVFSKFLLASRPFDRRYDGRSDTKMAALAPPLALPCQNMLLSG